MTILPHRNNLRQSAAQVLAELKKGTEEKRNEFVWVHLEPVYAVAYMATGNPDTAAQLTIMSFVNAFAALKQINPKQITTATWDWIAKFIVDVCAEYHAKYSSPSPGNPRTDPTADGSAQMDWETTVILGIQRVRRCLSNLPPEQQKVFLLRHHLQLNYEQIAYVLNVTPEDIMAWLYRARVQIVKCLGRG